MKLDFFRFFFSKWLYRVKNENSIDDNGQIQLNTSIDIK